MCDAIIAYVDGTDKTWIENYNKFVKNPLENVESRFRSYDVLDIQVKLIRKFMPFIDKIFIVVSNLSQLDHVIDELKKLDKVFIVTHEEIIPKRYLPCFNSCTIEMYLHNIKKLDEKFLYFNDDIFPINETKESDFFNGGNICMKPGLKYFDEEICSVYEHNVINSTKLLYKDTKIYGKYNAIKPVHSVMPMFKSINERVWLEYHNEIEKSLTRTRHRKNINAYIFLNYLYQKKKYTSKQVECSYFSIFNDFKDINKSIKKSKVICINDKSEYYIDFDEWKKELRKFLECVLEGKEYIAPIKEESQVILNNTPLKVALCAIAKNENLYIREWVEWYKNLGISKIFLYDNNELDGEKFEEVINDYIESGFVKVINRRGIVKSVKSDKDGQTTQGLAYNDCYYNHYKEFDWICFFDIDEFLEIYDKYNGLYEFLNDFNEYDGIRVQWKMYGDNEQLYYENKTVFERFKNEKNVGYDKHVKQIINCHKEFDKELLFCAHGVLNKKYNFVNLNKNILKNTYMDIIPYNDLPVYLNHFYCKSTYEFLSRKYGKSSAVSGMNKSRNLNIEFLKKQYFEYNTITDDKLKMFNFYEQYTLPKNYDHVIVAFTSYKERLKYCHLVIDSLLNGIVKPYKIVLTLYKGDLKYITDELQNQIINNYVELFICDEDIKSHKKYFYVMQKYRDYPIITCDDDCILQNDFVESLVNNYKKFPYCVSARRVHKKTYEDNGHIKTYEKWIRHYDKELLPSYDLVAIGVGGILYPPNILNISKNNLEDIYKYITVDDIYLHYLELQNNVPIAWVPNKKNHPDIIPGSQETSLFKDINKANESDENSPNNVAIRNLLNK